MTRRVTVEQEKCVGSGQCVMTAPKVFAQDDKLGLVVVIDSTPPESEHDAVRDAVLTCPVQCIHFDE
ncbi:MAG: ferredoxin [Rhodobiaceae bacterium]|nr:ferredoxin [Rhodobiaceae bacterium]